MQTLLFAVGTDVAQSVRCNHRDDDDDDIICSRPIGAAAKKLEPTNLLLGRARFVAAALINLAVQLRQD